MKPITATLLTCASLASPSDWPYWLGADRSLVGDGSPPTEWGEEKNVAWKVPVPGHGLSSPVVVGDTIYLTTAVVTEAGVAAAKTWAEEEAKRAEEETDTGRPRMAMTPPTEHELRVLALDLATGETRWSRTAATLTPHEGTHADASFATPTIAVDGGRVHASFGSLGIFTYDADGELLWSHDLGDMSVSGAFGEGTSPVLASGNLVILWNHEGDSFLVAFDAETGDEAWRRPRERGTLWSSPGVARVGERELVVVVGPSTVAYDAATGEVAWSIGGDGSPTEEPREIPRGEGGPIATPIVSGGMLFTSMGGRRGMLVGVDVASEAADEGLESERIAWKHTGDTPGITTPLVLDGVLYVMKRGGGMLGAFDAASGEAHYTAERLDAVARTYASLVAAGGHVYITGRDGVFELVRAGEAFESVAVNRLDDRFDATPAIVGDRLLLRGHDHLYCIARR
ncbi:MAG: PQQ-binding-like beta-propeller repeat protein [Planctomycetota bacterium]